MLTTRPTKRDKANFFSRDLLFDILEDDKPIGSATFDPKAMLGRFTLEDKTYKEERAVAGQNGRRYILVDANGQELALAEQLTHGIAVSRGDQTFSFRQIKRPYHLFRRGSDQSLGWVGQEKFFTKTYQMNLPAEFDPAFQVFLLMLVLDVMMERLGKANT